MEVVALDTATPPICAMGDGGGDACGEVVVAEESKILLESAVSLSLCNSKLLCLSRDTRILLACVAVLEMLGSSLWKREGGGGIGVVAVVVVVVVMLLSVVAING